MLAAMRSVAAEYPELQMITEGFARSMRRRPYEDSEITDTLRTVQKYIDVILDEPKATENAV